MKTRSFAFACLGGAIDVTAASNKSGRHKKLRPGAKKITAAANYMRQ
ncbi:MAG: hypothetical protein WC790_02815 [Candidatus Paceibacterota bacterium]